MPLINNTPPVVTGPITVNLIEDSFVVRLADNANVYDSDLTDLPRAIGIPETLPPGIRYDPQWHQFIIDTGHPAFQVLGASMVTQIIVNYFVTDGFDTVPHALIVTVTGQNDGAVVSGIAAGAVTEDAVETTGGSMTVNDVDMGEAGFQVETGLTGTYGSLTLTADGQWRYTLNGASAAVQALNTGQTVTDPFTVHTLDGTPQALIVTVTGAEETVLTGTAGNDTIAGTANAEALFGLAGRDNLQGNGGGDTLNGGGGADSLYGGDGADVILFDALDRVQNGGAGLDTLSVGAAVTVNLAAADQISGDSGLASGFENVDASFAMSAVQLTGSAGDNSLAGGLAADRLTGGLGADVLMGNAGADRFILRYAADSLVTARDEIGDFTQGQDRLDVSALDAVTGGRDNAFVFVGGGDFTKAGQLRYDTATGVVLGDVNGDQIADFAVDIGLGLILTASDFVL